jgi:GT2 family glycosyltransferase
MISVIVPSYNASNTICSCLESLLAQVTGEAFEVLVVNSSDDRTVELVRGRFPAVRAFQLPARAFAGTARNTGVEHSKGELLAFIDSDCTAPSDWLERIAVRHRQGHLALGGAIVDGSPTFCSRAEYPLETIEFAPGNTERSVGFVSSANCAFSRQLFTAHGGFPEIRAGEDMVFCHRLSSAGVTMLFDPEIRVSHHNPVRLGAFVRKQLMHGEHSYRVRREADLPGSFLGHRLALPFLLPLFPFIRLLRVTGRSLALRNGLFRDIMLTFPLFSLGCLCWSAGFARGYVGDLFSN